MGTVIPGKLEGAGLRETLLASKTVTAAGSVSETAVTGLGCYDQAQIELKLTDAKAEAGDTLDVFIDTSFDGGTTWVNCVHFPQILGNGADALQFLATLCRTANPGEDVVALASDCAAGKVRAAVFGDRLAVRHTVADGGGGTQSFTFEVVALFT